MSAGAQGEAQPATASAGRAAPALESRHTVDLTPASPSPAPPTRPGTPTVVEEEQHSKSQRRGGQEDEADVARDHEIPHHQGDLVLVHPVPLQSPRCHGVLASRHARLSHCGPKLNPPLTHPRQSSHKAHMDPSSPLPGRLQQPQDLSFPRGSHPPLAGGQGRPAAPSGARVCPPFDTCHLRGTA